MNSSHIYVFIYLNIFIAASEKRNFITLYLLPYIIPPKRSGRRQKGTADPPGRPHRLSLEERIFYIQCSGNYCTFNTPRKVHTLSSPKREKSAAYLFPTPTLVPSAMHMCLRLGYKQRVALATRVKLENKYAALFPFLAGNEYAFYDIPLVHNILLCLNEIDLILYLLFPDC